MNNTTTSKGTAWNAKVEGNQYSLAKILAIWAAVTIPAFIMAWVVFPALTPDFKTDPIGAGMVRMGVFAVYLIWDFVLALIIVYSEEGTCAGRLSSGDSGSTPRWIRKPASHAASCGCG